MTAKGVVLVGRGWAGTLSHYVVGVEVGQVKAPRIEHVYGEHKFAAVDDVIESGRPTTALPASMAEPTDHGTELIRSAADAHGESL